MAPHVNLWVVARGINIGLNTRMYFADEHEANASDPVLNLIEWEVRRKTLIAEREVRGTEVVYRLTFICRARTKPSFSIFSRRGDHLRPVLRGEGVFNHRKDLVM